MKTVIMVSLVVGAGLFVFNTFNTFQQGTSPSDKENRPGKKEQGAASEPVDIHSIAVFIPYWNIPSSRADLSPYDTLIYFGVAPDENGSLISDLGFTHIKSFIENTSSTKKRLLTVRMLNAETNSAILEVKSRKSQVIEGTIDSAKTYGFDGIVLDLEMGVIPFSDIQQDITTFTEEFAQQTKAEDMTFAMTIYGDTFYRGRPYDVEALGKAIDEMYIMAYDFHKSRGEPGENFPFDRQEDYDFKHMIADFSAVVPREDITVIFGMYGYDWTLGEQGLPLKAAQAVPLLEIDTSGAIVHPVSKEKYVTFTDEEGHRHELWFEDEESVDVKMDYLKEQGIGKVGYWVWGYF